MEKLIYNEVEEVAKKLGFKHMLDLVKIYCEEYKSLYEVLKKITESDEFNKQYKSLNEYYTVQGKMENILAKFFVADIDKFRSLVNEHGDVNEAIKDYNSAALDKGTPVIWKLDYTKEKMAKSIDNFEIKLTSRDKYDIQRDKVVDEANKMISKYKILDTDRFMKLAVHHMDAEKGLAEYREFKGYNDALSSKYLMRAGEDRPDKKMTDRNGAVKQENETREFKSQLLRYSKKYILTNVFDGTITEKIKNHIEYMRDNNMNILSDDKCIYFRLSIKEYRKSILTDIDNYFSSLENKLITSRSEIKYKSTSFIQLVDIYGELTPRLEIIANRELLKGISEIISKWSRYNKVELDGDIDTKKNRVKKNRVKKQSIKAVEFEQKSIVRTVSLKESLNKRLQGNSVIKSGIVRGNDTPIKRKSTKKSSELDNITVEGFEQQVIDETNRLRVALNVRLQFSRETNQLLYAQMRKLILIKEVESLLKKKHTIIEILLKMLGDNGKDLKYVGKKKAIYSDLSIGAIIGLVATEFKIPYIETFKTYEERGIYALMYTVYKHRYQLV